MIAINTAENQLAYFTASVRGDAPMTLVISQDFVPNAALLPTCEQPVISFSLYACLRCSRLVLPLFRSKHAIMRSTVHVPYSHCASSMHHCLNIELDRALREHLQQYSEQPNSLASHSVKPDIV
eukprot:15466-Heterococcus_DN1.PRE.3